MSRQVTFRCPDDVLEALLREEAVGKARTDVILEALRAHLDLESPGAEVNAKVLAAQLQEAFVRIRQLEEGLASTNEQLKKTKVRSAKAQPEPITWRQPNVQASWLKKQT